MSGATFKARKCLVCYLKPFVYCAECNQVICEKCYWKLSLRPWTKEEYDSIEMGEFIDIPNEDSQVDLTMDVNFGYVRCPRCKKAGRGTIQRYTRKTN